MKKDLKSYKKHNKQYYTEHNSYENTLRIIEEYNKENVFRKLGFKLAIKLSKDLPSTHVDISALGLAGF